MTILLRRFILAIPTLLLLSLVVFLLLDLTPGDAALITLDASASADQEAHLRETLGLNKPVVARYVGYISGLLQGDLGVSARSGMSVAHEISTRLPYTLLLVGVSILFGTLFGGLLGCVGACCHDTPIDTLVTGLVSIGQALPTFWLALLFVNLFALQLRWLPVFGADSLQHLILPALCTSLTLVPGIARLTRASLLEAMDSHYIAFARAKGLRNTRVLFRHISPIAAISLVTYIGLQTVRLVTSVAIMETIFNWPGLGGLAIRAAFDRDAVLLLGTTLTIAVITFIVLFLVDVTVVYLDPRIRKVV